MCVISVCCMKLQVHRTRGFLVAYAPLGLPDIPVKPVHVANPQQVSFFGFIYSLGLSFYGCALRRGKDQTGPKIKLNSNRHSRQLIATSCCPSCGEVDVDIVLRPRKSCDQPRKSSYLVRGTIWFAAPIWFVAGTIWFTLRAST